MYGIGMQLFAHIKYLVRWYAGTVPDRPGLVRWNEIAQHIRNRQNDAYCTLRYSTVAKVAYEDSVRLAAPSQRNGRGGVDSFAVHAFGRSAPSSCLASHFFLLRGTLAICVYHSRKLIKKRCRRKYLRQQLGGKTI